MNSKTTDTSSSGRPPKITPPTDSTESLDMAPPGEELAPTTPITKRPLVFILLGVIYTAWLVLLLALATRLV